LKEESWDLGLIEGLHGGDDAEVVMEHVLDGDQVHASCERGKQRSCEYGPQVRIGHYGSV